MSANILKLKALPSLFGLLALLLLGAQSANALDLPLDGTLCNRAYTYIRPTPAERNSSVGFHWQVSYSDDISAPKLVSRYYDWTLGSPVYGPYNRTFGSANGSSDPSYLFELNLRPLWNSTWREPPAYAGRSYINVRLVTNISRSTMPSGETALGVTYLLGSDGAPVRANTTRSLNCNLFINADGTPIATASTYKSSGLSRAGFIAVMCCVALFIVGLIVFWINYPRVKRMCHALGDRQWYVKRKWHAWRRTQAIERMEQPAYIDDTEKLGGGSNEETSAEPPSGALPRVSERSPSLPTPECSALAELAARMPGARVDPDRIDAGPAPADAMDGDPKPPPAYIAPPTYPSKD